MFFMELPESGTIINLGAIAMIEHVVDEGTTAAVIYFEGGTRKMLSGKDAIALIERMQQATF
jgi:hypothetical protein